MLTERKKRFAFEYMKDGIGLRSAIRAGYSEAGAADTACRLLADPEVQALIDEHKETAAMVAQLSPAWVLRQWMLIASADPSELMRVEVRPCPSCYDEQTQLSLRDTPFYKPNPECSLCNGDGQKFTYIADTRHLSPAGKRLYAGLKQTKDGIEIKTHNQAEAISNLAKYLGMLVDKKELSGPGGGPMQLQAVKRAEDLSDDELALIIAGEAMATPLLESEN